MMHRETTLHAVDRLRIRFWLSQTVLLIALGGIISESINRSPILIALTAFLFLSLFFPPIAGGIPRKWMRFLSWALIVTVLIDLFINRHQPFDSILRASYLVLWTRTLFYRTSRESMQLLLLALFLIVLTGVMSLSISYVVQLVCFAPLGMVLLMLNTTKDPSAQDCLTHTDWTRFRLSVFCRKIRATLNWPLVGIVAASSLFMLVSITIIFTVLPRFHFRQLIPSLSLPGISKAGFSEGFELGSITSIVEDPSVAFRVEVSDPAQIPNSPYWRMLSLDVYSNGAFSQTTQFARKLRIPELMTSGHFLSNRMIQDPTVFSRNTWTFYLEGSVSRYLPLPSSFRSIQFQTLQFMRVDPVFGTVRIRETASNLTSYRLHSVDPTHPFRASALDALLETMNWTVIDPNDRRDIAQLSYPGSTLTAIISEADADYLEKTVTTIQRSVMADDIPHLESRARFATAVSQYLQEQHSYSLQSKLPILRKSDDTVIAWMQSDSSGHCEYFAAAAALLLRANNIPSRIVTGFSGGEWNRSKSAFIVRNLHAHAWCEFYDENGQWTRLDPTPPTRFDLNSFKNPNSSSSFNGWFGWVEGLKLNYYRSIVNFDDASQLEIISKFSQRLQRANFHFGNFGKRFSNWFKEPKDSQSENKDQNTILKTIILLGVAGLILIFAAYLFISFRKNRNDHTNNSLSKNAAWEKKMRQKAKHFLRKLEHYREVDPAWILRIKTIRFGPVSSWDQPKYVFKSIQSIARQQRKNQKLKK